MPKPMTKPADEEEEVVDDQQQEEAPQEEELQDEEEQEDEPQEDEEEDTGEQEEEDPLDKKPMSRRERLRVEDLLKKFGDPRDRAPAPQQDGIDYRSMIDADDEVIAGLEEAAKQYGQSQYERGQQTADKIQFSTRLDIDSPRVDQKFPQMDENSPEFNPAVASAINEMYLAAAGYDPRTGNVKNPDIRYFNYVDAMFELVEEAASRQTENTRRTVTKQAGRTGIRPDGSTSKAPALDLNKDPRAMSDKELDAAMAKVGLANPKKK